MLEFALILPAFMFLILFTFDMGHLVLMSGAMQDATFSAARTGAQVGGAAINVAPPGSIVCPTTASSQCKSGTTWESLQSTATQIPGYDRGIIQLNSMTIVSGGLCKGSGNDDHVELQVRYTTALITPGLGSLMRLATGSDEGANDSWNLRATAVARCEVVRTQ